MCRMEVKYQRNRMKTYGSLLLGKKALDALVYGRCSNYQEEVVDILCTLYESFRLFKHVTQDHWFVYEVFFYHFKGPRKRSKQQNQEQLRNSTRYIELRFWLSVMSPLKLLGRIGIRLILLLLLHCCWISLYLEWSTCLFLLSWIAVRYDIP